MAEVYLTCDEREVVSLLGQCWNRITRLVGNGPSRQGDLAEAVIHVHALQQMVMSQAAARAYPGEFRLLGESLQPSGSAAKGEHNDS